MTPAGVSAAVGTESRGRLLIGDTTELGEQHAMTGRAWSLSSIGAGGRLVMRGDVGLCVLSEDVGDGSRDLVGGESRGGTEVKMRSRAPEEGTGASNGRSDSDGSAFTIGCAAAGTLEVSPLVCTPPVGWRARAAAASAFLLAWSEVLRRLRRCCFVWRSIMSVRRSRRSVSSLMSMEQRGGGRTPRAQRQREFG